MKKIICVLLLFCLLLPTFASCKPGTGNDNTTTAETTEETAETTEEVTTERGPRVSDDLQLVSGGKTKFKIIYVETDDQDFITALQGLRTALHDVTGVWFQTKTDEVAFGATADSDAYEILIGDTTRIESDYGRDDVGGIKNYGYLIEGHKICFVGSSIKDLISVITAFRNRFLKSLNVPEGETLKEVTFSASNEYVYSYPYTYAGTKLFGTDLSLFSIVYPKNGSITVYRAAARIQRMIANMAGVKLPLVKDSESNTPYEFRVGKTSRTVSAEPDYMKYQVNVSGTSVEYQAGSICAYESLLNYLNTKLLSGLQNANADAGMLKSADATADVKANKDNAFLGSNSELRIVYHNVWGFEDSATTPRLPDSANLMLAELYKELAADVYCMQEYTEFVMRKNAGHTVMDYLLSSGYKEIASSGDKTCTPILYNTATLELLNSTSYGTYKFQVEPAVHLWATWAVFKMKNDNSKQFAVVSLHFTASSDSGRCNQVSELNNQILQMLEGYGVPILVGGDTNSSATSQAFQNLLGLGYTDVHTLATWTDNSGGCYWGYPTYDSFTKIHLRINGLTNYTYDSNAVVDHIVYKGTSLKFDAYDVLDDMYSGAISDHAPTCLDFGFQ